jgi:hypothetical protein
MTEPCMICLTVDQNLFFEGTPQCRCKLHIHIQCLQKWLEVNRTRQCPLCRNQWGQTPEEPDTLETTRCYTVLCLFGILGWLIGMMILESIR